MSGQRDMSTVPSAELPFYDEADELWRVPLTSWDGRGFGDNGAELFNYVTVGTTTGGAVYLEDGAGGNDTVLTIAEAELLVDALRAAIERAKD
jgi:hypothetical protein